MRRPTLAIRWLAVSAAAWLGPGCITAMQGTGPVARPTDGDEFGGRVTLAGGGGSGESDVGVFQATIAGTPAIADWFGLEVGVSVNGVYDARNAALRGKQDLTTNWGLWPYVAPTFYIGPVDLRLILFGIGGGGPEGPAGFMGLAGGTLGYRFDGGQAWAGFTAQAVFGCCNGEYSGVFYQVPIGIEFFEVPFGETAEDGSMRLGLELIWARNAVGRSSADEEYDTVILLGSVSLGVTE